MALGPTGNVAGTVLGPDGGPVSGIAVVAYSTTDDGFPSRSSRGAQTDAFGRYDIANIAPGTYKVEFLDPSGRLAGEFWNDTLTYQTATVVNVEASQVTTLGPTTLALPVSISQPGPVLPGAGTGTAAVITVAQRPRIVGRTRVGRTLRVRPGTWSPAAVNLTYQWFARGVAIERATTSTLRLTRALRGKRIQVQVTASRIGSMPVMAASPRTARIKPRR
nr:carboxypeptidase regulatory-like domain-containing protein [Nocardioides flavescens]